MINDVKDISMRHEEKYICSEMYLRMIESRLKAVLSKDINQMQEDYEVRSVYFDTIAERFYEEGLEGLEQRNKYRIRIYNGNADFIKLEKKSSIRSLKKKTAIQIPQEKVRGVLQNEVLEISDDSENLMKEFAMLQNTILLRPKLIVRYYRTAYISDIGNIRITLDRNIGVSNCVEDFFENDVIYTPILPQNIHLLEIKYDGILPGYLARLLNREDLRRTSFSKYVLGIDTIRRNGRMNENYEF